MRSTIDSILLASVAALAALLLVDGTAAAEDFDCDPDALSGAEHETCLDARLTEGMRLFDQETFDGNGRTCLTCHSGRDGTIDPQEVKSRLRRKGSDPLFVHDGLDDFFFGTSRIEENATILVQRDLPEGVVLVDDPSATSVVVARGVPSTLNTPALDPALMYDLRNLDLQEQALGAVHGHAQNLVEPTPLELDLIAEFQQRHKSFFSNGRLRRFAAGGSPPELPQGRSESEKRGREFFVDAPWDPPNKKGACAICHSGPMLNTTNDASPPATGAPSGWRALDILVSARNLLDNPVHTFDVTDACGTTIRVESPDPGILLTGVYDIPMLAALLPPEEFCILHPAFFKDMHKTPSLWGVARTAPYFHDNSARTLEDVMEQYRFMFESHTGFPITESNILLTDQDIVDIIAFLELL